MTLGLASCKIPRTASRVFAVPSNPSEAKSRLPSLLWILTMSSPSRNSLRTFPLPPSPSLFPPAVKSPKSIPLDFSALLRRSKLCATLESVPTALYLALMPSPLPPPDLSIVVPTEGSHFLRDAAERPWQGCKPEQAEPVSMNGLWRPAAAFPCPGRPTPHRVIPSLPAVGRDRRRLLARRISALASCLALVRWLPCCFLISDH